MKYFIILFSFFSSLLSFAQKGGSYYTQKEWLENAEKPDYAGDNHKLMAAYFYAYKEDPETRDGKEALAKSDSLKILSRTNIINGVQGKWKLEKSGSNWGYKDSSESDKASFLSVEKDIATFYTIDSTGKKEITKTEKLIFTNVDGEFYFVLEFLYADNSVWSYTVTGDKLKMYNIGGFQNGGISIMVCGNAEYYYSKVQN